MPGEFFEFSFDNFTFNSIEVSSGTYRIQNTGQNGSGNETFSLNINMVTNLKAEELELTGNHAYTLEVVPNPADPRDNQLVYQGSGSGVTQGGLTFTQNITSPLIRKSQAGCDEYFVQGSVLIQSPSLPYKLIDYGTGRCDNEASVTENGITTTIYLTN
ncbi:MAG: hypothetical protein JNK66_05185 [Chitinophagales bacterium]|nr:hypothetical protein [Chitinophagales bacterium]